MILPSRLGPENPRFLGFRKFHQNGKPRTSRNFDEHYLARCPKGTSGTASRSNMSVVGQLFLFDFGPSPEVSDFPTPPSAPAPRGASLLPPSLFAEAAAVTALPLSLSRVSGLWILGPPGGLVRRARASLRRTVRGAAPRRERCTIPARRRPEERRRSMRRLRAAEGPVGGGGELGAAIAGRGRVRPGPTRIGRAEERGG